MTEAQKEELNIKFKELEKYSTWLVLFLFSIIVILSIIDPHSAGIQSYVQVSFSICLFLVFFFVFLSLIKDLLFPIVSKFYFKK